MFCLVVYVALFICCIVFTIFVVIVYFLSCIYLFFFYYYYLFFFFFFFSSRRRHTRCLSNWSSDVCSSDLSGSNLYAGGEFTTAGGSAVNYIAKWNGSSWSALGSGMSSTVFALAVSGSEIGRASCRERV